MPPPLPVPYFRQKSEGYCLAACAQMVLHFWGIEVEQERIARQLGVIDGLGAPAGRIKLLQYESIAITYDGGTWETAATWLERQVPVIALIQAGELDFWRGEYFQHAVVVIDFAAETGEVHLLDPAASPGYQIVSLDEFILAWGEMDFRFAVLERMNQ